jgi:hypothetical protein
MRATTTASSVSTALTVSSTMLSTFSTAGLVFLNENISSISHGLSIIPGGGEGPSSGTPRMRRANKWAKKEYGEDAKIYYSKKDGKLYLKRNIGSDYQYHPGTPGDILNPDNSPILSEVQIGFVKIGLEESFLNQFSTWNKFKDIVNTGLDFIPIVSNFKGVVEGIVGYDLAGNKLTWDERILGATGVYSKFKKGFKLLNAIDDASSVKNGSKGVRNSHLAGKVHPKTGVPFDKAGFPNFSGNLYKGGVNDVMIKPTGNRVADFAAANKAAGYSSTPKGYTWHHHQTTGRMQLVETGVHSQTGHTGGFSLWKY